MKGRAELPHDLPRRSAVVMVEDMHVEPALDSDHCGEQADRSGPGDQQCLRRPDARTAADSLGMVPRLGDNTGRLDQNTVAPQRWIELEQKFRRDAEKIRAVAVELLDAT